MDKKEIVFSPTVKPDDATVAADNESLETEFYDDLFIEQQEQM